MVWHAALLLVALQDPRADWLDLPPPRTEVFVSPAGADSAVGSRDRPLASLARAFAVLEQRGGPNPTITLLEGAWSLDGGLRFGPEHHGWTLRAADGARPVLLGGRRITAPALAPVRDPEILDRLPTDAARAAVRVLALPAGSVWAPPVHRGMGSPVIAVGTELVVDGTLYRRARWPNQGFATVGEVLDPGSVPRNRADDVPPAERETGPERGGVFRFDPARLERWRRAPSAWMVGYWFHDWADEQLPVESVDPEAGTVELGLPHRYGLKSGTSFYVTNLLEELDAPGEFHLDGAHGRLYLWPENPQVNELLLTTLADPAILLRGARGVRLEGITIRGTRGAAVVAEDCQDLLLQDLRIEQTGTHGIDIRGGRGNTVAGCTLTQIGASGIRASGGDRASLRPAGHRLVGNSITWFGRLYRTYQPGIALDGVGQVAAGNRIAHAPHSGILFGGNEHRIVRNEIFDVLTETGDCGAIYCGRDWAMHGTVIRHNFIHDLRGVNGRWQNAIYLDDMASGIEVSGNLVWRCHWGMLIGGGRDLKIDNNVFAECDLGIRFDARGVGWMAPYIADPATSTLHRRLAGLPVDRPPWSERYPTVQRTLSDRFGRPAGSRVSGNVFLATPEGSVADREAVLVGGAEIHPEAPDWIHQADDGSLAARFDRGQAWGIPLLGLDGGGLVLAEAGHSAWSIVVADDAVKLEGAAAKRLQAFLEGMSGARMPVVRESQAPARRRILVGDTRLAEERFAAAPPLRVEDGYAIRAAGGDLFLQSGGGLGIDYAVTALLEGFGCRMWAPNALHVPELDTLRLPRGFELVEEPAVWFRQVNYGPADDPEYRRWHKLDRIQEETGRLWAPYWVHSLLRLVPPEEFFEAHPDYYALVGGERRPTQLCLSNPEVLRLVVERIERMLVEHPGVRYISVSQADNYEHCQCPDARAINQREESAMGEMLSFVNAVAEAFPDRIISTLAYQYTRKPPKTLRPRANVSIMLCTIEEDRAQPIPDNPGSRFASDFEGWVAICDDIFLWDYEVRFASPVAPFPNLRVLQPNVKWFVDHGVRHLFLQGNGLRTEMAELRCYLLAKLAWNADTDVSATIDEFLAGYYGEAAPFLRRFLDLLHDEMEASGQPLLIYGNPALAKDSWLRPEVLDQADSLLAQAEQAVAAFPVRAQRVRVARLPLQYAELEIAKRRGTGEGGVFQRSAGVADGGEGDGGRRAWQVRPRLRDLLDRFVRGAETAGIRRLRERELTPAEYRAAWGRLLDPSRLQQPAFGKEVRAAPPPSPRYADGQASRLTDGMPGGELHSENWVGWEGCDAVITLDLGAPVPLRGIRFSALQDPKAWIWLPLEVRVESSKDSLSWRPLATLRSCLPEREGLIHSYTAEWAGAEIRYLRLRVDAGEVCPTWHVGAGGASWFFLDEIELR